MADKTQPFTGQVNKTGTKANKLPAIESAMYWSGETESK